MDIGIYFASGALLATLLHFSPSVSDIEILAFCMLFAGFMIAKAIHINKHNEDDNDE